MIEKPVGQVDGHRYVNMPLTVASDKSIPHSAFLIYGMIANRCGDQIEVEVSHSDIAADARLSRSCVISGIAALERAGHIRVIGRRPGKIKRYRLVAFED